MIAGGLLVAHLLLLLLPLASVVASEINMHGDTHRGSSGAAAVFSRRRCPDKEVFFREMEASESMKKSHLTHKHCNKVNCGHWDLDHRNWIPKGCVYQNITVDNAHSCLKGRTLVFVGDSNLRDLVIGLVYFLEGKSVTDASNSKFDKHLLDTENDNAFKALLYNNWIRPLPPLKMWNKTVNTNLGGSNGYVYNSKNGIQIQLWSMFNKNLFISNIEDILNNKVQEELTWLNRADVAFLHRGLHNLDQFKEKPYGKNYFSNVITPWLDIREKVSTPSVWVSFNNNCLENLLAKWNWQKFIDFDLQRDIIEDANAFINDIHSEKKFPYWDASSVLRSPQRCNVSDDGVHVKMWVDMVRANMMLNHLCDQAFNWVGGADRFL